MLVEELIDSFDNQLFKIHTIDIKDESCVNCFNCRTKLNYANARKLLDPICLSPIGILLGVGLAWGCYLKLQNKWNKIESDRLKQFQWKNRWNKTDRIPYANLKKRESGGKYELPRSIDSKTTKTSI